jgi:4'-phosphopantetheinyl transferase
MDAVISTFERRANAPALDHREIHVWWLALHASETPRAIANAARTTLERMLCAYSEIPLAPTIERGPHGKPFAPALPGLEFNLSHAGRHILLAFARGQALGVDLEQLDRRVSVNDIAERYFTDNEAHALRQLPPADKLSGFLRLWTHKEAVLKALGEGLAFGLDRIEFALDDEGRVVRVQQIAADAGVPSEWNLRTLAPARDLIGALAWSGPLRTVRAFELIA